MARPLQKPGWSMRAAGQLALALSVAIPSGARAAAPGAGAGTFWEQHGTVLLVTGSSIANIAGLFPGIGSSIGLGFEVPNRMWSVAGMAAGGAQMTFGGLSLATGASYPNRRWLAIYGGVTAVLGVSNLVLGIINLVRRAHALDQMRLLERRWVVAPAPMPDGGGGLNVRIEL